MTSQWRDGTRMMFIVQGGRAAVKMKTLLRFVVVPWIAAARLVSQTLEVHSEFLRVNPQGEILAADATPKPREILSPALVRNGFASFQIVVRSPRPTNYFLFVGSNPPNVFRTEIYKETFVKRGDDWIPDTLEPLRSPNLDSIPGGGVPRQTACAYLLDVWVPRDTPAGTVRLEAQLKVGDWTIYPMEVRILPVTVPATAKLGDPLPEIGGRLDEAVMAPLLAFLNGKPSGPAGRRAPQTLRDVVRRNAEQDMALARALDSGALRSLFRQKLEAPSLGGEWYLEVRDLIYRESSRAPGK